MDKRVAIAIGVHCFMWGFVCASIYYGATIYFGMWCAGVE